MQLDETGGRLVPSLVSLCQRVAGAHIDFISNLGSEITFDLARPVLERCSAEQLLHIEESSPHLQNETHDLWMGLCNHRYPKMAVRYTTGEEHDPETWKERYFAMQEAEARRLGELSSRLRSRRQEADERKKEREIKVTDCLPPAKRTRNGWLAPTQPKSLLQKTRSEASRIQRTVYSARVVPPMLTAKNYTLATKPTIPVLLPPVPQMDGQPNRVTVNTIKRPMNPPTSAITKPPLPCQVTPVANSPIVKSKSLSDQPPLPSPSGEPPTRKTVRSPKKDPTACLFLPKRPTKV